MTTNPEPGYLFEHDAGAGDAGVGVVVDLSVDVDWFPGHVAALVDAERRAHLARHAAAAADVRHLFPLHRCLQETTTQQRKQQQLWFGKEF